VLIILFGLSGSGKNFVGEIFAKEFNVHFWDADLALPIVMRDCIQQQISFTQAMRNAYTQDIIEHIQHLKTSYAKLVVAQGLYREENRAQIAMAFPQAVFIEIKAYSSLIQQRLQKPGSGIELAYAEKISQHFEIARLPHHTITNNTGAAAIIEQISRLFPSI
jgi:gluconokinase